MRPIDPPLAVTGTGMVTAAGRGEDAVWEALCAGRCLVVSDSDPALAGFGPVVAARCAPIDPAALGADRRAIRLMGHQSHMLLAGVSGALEGAFGGVGDIPGDDTAFFAGLDSVDPGPEDLARAALASKSSEGGVDFGKFFREGMAQIRPLWPLEMLNAIDFCQVAIQFGLRGDNATFSPGPEAGGRALIEAAQSVREGNAQFALAAGLSPVVSARSVARYLQRGFLVPVSAGRAPAPFSGTDGTALGEGAGAVVLESFDEARKNGKTISGLLKGWGRGTAVPVVHALSAAIRDAAQEALDASGLSPSEVDLVIPHGQGVKEEDAEEIEALSGLFGDRRPYGVVTKGAFGHLLAGAPFLDIIVALRALREGTVPPSPGVAEMAGDILRFPGSPVQERELKRALVMSRGFEGACMAFVLEAA